jgi:hypothetical protein
VVDATGSRAFTLGSFTTAPANALIWGCEPKMATAQNAVYGRRG